MKDWNSHKEAKIIITNKFKALYNRKMIAYSKVLTNSSKKFNSRLKN